MVMLLKKFIIRDGSGVQKKEQKRTCFPSALFSSFVFVTILLPKAPINKFLFLILYLVIFMGKVCSNNTRITVFPAFLFILAIFSYGLILSLVGDSEIGIAIQYFFSIFILPLVYFIERYQIDIEKIIEISGLLLVFWTVIFYLSFFFPGNSLTNQMMIIYETYNYTSVDTRAASYFNLDGELATYMLGTTPFLFLPWVLIINKFVVTHQIKDAVILLILGVAILFSGSRGLVIVSGVFLLLAIQNRTSSYKRICLIIGLGMSFYWGIHYLLQETTILSSSEVSNRGKIGHIESFLEDISWFSAFFGRGLASYYFSSGSGAFQSYTEITPMDLMRYFGIPLTLLVYICILFPSLELSIYKGENKMRMIAMLLYIVLSATNPVMFNSFGMLVLLWYWTKIRESQVLKKSFK